MQNIPEELKYAVSFLDDYNGSKEQFENVQMFGKGMRTLKQYMDENPDTPHQSFIIKTRTTHSRKFLENLKDREVTEPDGRLNILLEAFANLNNDELEAVFSMKPSLRKVYRKFLDLCSVDVEYIVKRTERN